MKCKKSVILSVIVILLCALLSSVAAVAGPGDNNNNTTSLVTSATEYDYGAPVYVTATTNSKNAWVGIYPAGQTPGSVDSIYWYYVKNNNGVASGTTVDIKGGNSAITFNSTMAAYEGLPAGDYTIYLFGDKNTNKISAQVNITVLPPPVPAAPTSITYTRTATKTGFADGTVTVKLDLSGGTATDIVLYWADGNGTRLSGYTHLQKQPVGSGVSSLTFDLVKNTLIPQGAEQLIAYASNSAGLSTSAASVTIDSRLSNYDFGEPLYEFQIVSDIHVTSTDTHMYNTHFKSMLQDIVSVSPDSKGIMIVGDITDNGTAEEYENVLEIYDSVSGAPDMYWNMGNHDFGLYSGNYSDKVNLFYQYSNADSVYYDMWIDGIHYIFLGSEAVDTSAGVTAIISDTQVAWLEEKLAENYKAGRPIFVFLHQSVYNTVAGSLPGQNWDGIGNVGSSSNDSQEQAIMAALAAYPEAMFFSGHSHWELNSVGTMYDRTDSMCTAFNTASIAYLWTSYGDTYSSGEYYNQLTHGGSQGYYVQVYEDKVLVLGRDFEEQAWMPSAMFCVDYSELIPDVETLITGTVSGDTVAVAEQNTSVSTVIDSYKSVLGASNVTVKYSSGSTASTSARIATGMIVDVDGTEYTIIVKGDVNSDGNINISDADAVLQYIRTGEGLDSAELDAAGAANGSGSIDILTVTAIVNELFS